MRYLDSETVRILYRAKRNTLGLTDVKIDIWDNSGTKVVNSKSLTELSNGLYYYDYTLSSIGNFLYNISCASQPHDTGGTFQSVGRNSLWVKKSGGGGAIIPDLKIKEFEKIQEILEKIKESFVSLQKTTSKSFSKYEEDKSVLNSIEEKLTKLTESVELNSSIIVGSAPTKVLLNLENGSKEN